MRAIPFPMASVRSMRREDLEAVGRLAGKLVRLHFEFDSKRFLELPNAAAGYTRYFGTIVDSDEVVLLVAEDEGKVVGYAYAALEERSYNELREACGALHDIYVDESARGRGLGEALVKEVLARMAKKGQPRVVLLTAVQNKVAQKLFEKHGFRTTMLEMTCEL